MSITTNKLPKQPSIVIENRSSIEDEIQKIWEEIRNNVNGILAIGIVSRVGFPISTHFTAQEMDDDKCAAMVASVISVADRLGTEFDSLGPFRQSIFTNESGYLLFYDIELDSILFCILKAESTKLGLINYVIQQKIPLIKSFLDP